MLNRFQVPQKVQKVRICRRARKGNAQVLERCKDTGTVHIRRRCRGSMTRNTCSVAFPCRRKFPARTQKMPDDEHMPHCKHCMSCFIVHVCARVCDHVQARVLDDFTVTGGSTVTFSSPDALRSSVIFVFPAAFSCSWMVVGIE